MSACTLLGLSTPRGLRFSEVTDSTAMVHWSMPHSPVDNYRITYMPFEGGKWFVRVAALQRFTAGLQCLEMCELLRVFCIFA